MLVLLHFMTFWCLPILLKARFKRKKKKESLQGTAHLQFGSHPFSPILKPMSNTWQGHNPRVTNRAREIQHLSFLGSLTLSLSPQQASLFFSASLLLLHHHRHISIKGTKIKACWRKQGKTSPILLDPHNATRLAFRLQPLVWDAKLACYAQW